MSQKTSPYLMRVGYSQNWNDIFFSKNKRKNAEFIQKNIIIRKYLLKLFPDIARIGIEQKQNIILIFLEVMDVSIVLGEGKKNLSKMRERIKVLIKDSEKKIEFKLSEIKKRYTNAQLISNLIASELMNRVPFRSVLSDVIYNISLEREIKGAKIVISGRLGGIEIARKEKAIYGKIPLSTIDSNIDVGEKEVTSTPEQKNSYGKIGIKVFLYKGRIWKKRNNLSTTRKK